MFVNGTGYDVNGFFKLTNAVFEIENFKDAEAGLASNVKVTVSI
jgi:hypothetical protein